MRTTGEDRPDIVLNLEGSRFTPSWELLDALIRSAYHGCSPTHGNTECECFLPHGRLIQIHRRDRGCGYREPGDYDLTYDREDGSAPLLLWMKVV